MTLSKRYHAVMDRIEVTDAMRRRILDSVGRIEPDAAPRSRAAGFPFVRRLMPLAACLVLLLAGVFSARYLMTADPMPTGGVLVDNEIAEAADAGALSEMVGFPVKEVVSLPFQADEVTYTSFWRELAEITYTGHGQTVTFRQSLGNGDNSGDYTIYAEAMVKEIGGLSVTLKGDGQVYPLVVWSDGTYAYSINAQPGFPAQEWEAVIANIK